MAHSIRAILDLCKRRGFLYQSAEIYGGLRGAYDYGPLGVELKKNILNSWWRQNVYYRDDVVGLDTSIITPHPVLKASGHVDEFTDLLVDCTLTKERFRPDKAPSVKFLPFEEKPESGEIPILAPDKETAKSWQKIIREQLAPGIMTSVRGSHIHLHVESLVEPNENGEGGSITFKTSDGPEIKIGYHGYVEPTTNSPFLTDSRPFNLMFKTFLDPIDPIERVIQTTKKHNVDGKQSVREAVDDVLRPSTVFLRPETAQGVFINFEQVTRTMKTKPPFGIAQVGKSFRNEIRLEHGIFRTPEFEQMELEYFVAPWESGHWFSYWRERRYKWWLDHACYPKNFRQRDHEKNEMAHYATGCTDVEYLYPWGWGEVEGVANRGNFDLTQHINNTNANFEVVEDEPRVSADITTDHSLVPKEKPARYVPHVVESSCGLNRAMLAYLCDAFHQVTEEGTNKQSRTILRLDPRLAPIKCAVMPLTGKPEFMPIVEKVAKSLRRQGWYTVVEAQKLKIGKRYYRHDEVGTPWCVTVDYQSLEDGTVTLRDRDTGAQQRLAWQDVKKHIGEKLTDPSFYFTRWLILSFFLLYQMAGQNPIIHCLERLFLADDTLLLEKAEHFQGLCSTRVPSKVFEKGPNCKPVISIHLANENLGRHDWDSKLAAELAGCKPAVYDTAVSLTRKHLGIVPVVSFESLTVALGCTTMIKQVESLWASFQEIYLGNLSAAKRLSAKDELSQPVWKGAVVYACAKALGESVTKAPLQSLCSCSLPELTKCIKVVTDISKKPIGELKAQSTKASRVPRSTGKRRVGEDDDVVEDTAVKKVKVSGVKKPAGRPKKTDSKVAAGTKEYKPTSGIVSMINRQDYRQTRRYRDYVQWKNLLIERLSNSMACVQ